MEIDFPDIITDHVHETHCLKCAHLMDVSSLAAFVQIECPHCQTIQRVPGQMGAFLLMDLLGKGGMGAVFRARDPALNRWVAVKVLHASYGSNTDIIKTFQREAQMAAALSHPNIVQIYSLGVAHGQPFMAMELLEGGRLDQMIFQKKMIDESHVMKIAANVVEGLMAAANIKLIHGDVKPENILMDNHGIAKVVDFGLARFKEGDSKAMLQGIWGTPYYIAPEKLHGQQSDVRSDIYSLGATVFHALALQPPFDAETITALVKARLDRPAPLLRSLRPGIHQKVESIVQRMLETDPTRRYPNYTSVLADIRQVIPALPRPRTNAIGQSAKKNGRIALSKKKSGPPRSTGIMNSASQTALGDTRGATLSRESTARHSSGMFKVVIGLSLGCVAVAGCILLGSSSSKVDHAPNGSVKLPRPDRTQLPETPAPTVAVHPVAVQQPPAMRDPLPRPERSFHPIAASLAPLPVPDTTPVPAVIIPMHSACSTTGTEFTVDSDTVALWHLNGNANDSSGHGYSLLLTNGPSFATGGKATGWMKNPTGFSLRVVYPQAAIGIIPSSIFEGKYSPITIEARLLVNRWGPITNGYTYCGYHQKWSSSLHLGQEKWKGPRISGYKGMQLVSTPEIESCLATGVWHHLMLTFNGTNDYRVIVDGFLVGSSASQAPDFSSYACLTNEFGNFDGYLDEIRISRSDRSCRSF